MKRNLMFIFLAIFISNIVTTKVLAKKKFSPLSNLNLSETYFSPGDLITITGNGFINHFEDLYQIKLVSETEKFDLSISELKLDRVKVLIPEEIPYGDYALSIKLKSRYLKSKRYVLKHKIKIRPEALALNITAEEVFFNKFDVKNYLLSSLEQVLREKNLREDSLNFYLNNEAFNFETMNLNEGKIKSKSLTMIIILIVLSQSL